MAEMLGDVEIHCGGLVTGRARDNAQNLIRKFHYTHNVPAGKSHYFVYGAALVVWSIPANKNIAKFILGYEGNVWELSRLWAPNGHEPNLLTKAISLAVKAIKAAETPDALVSYADPSAGHSGGVYKAASWIYHGRSEEVRAYRGKDGLLMSRRAFHSGSKGLRKAEIEALGFQEVKLPGKHRFVFPLSKKAKAAVLRS